MAALFMALAACASVPKPTVTTASSSKQPPTARQIAKARRVIRAWAYDFARNTLGFTQDMAATFAEEMAK